MTRQSQNVELQQAYQRAIEQRGLTGGPFSVGLFNDPTQPRGRKIVLSDRPSPRNPSQKMRICLPMACTGTCFSNCKGYHGPYNQQEVQRVCDAGGFTL